MVISGLSLFLNFEILRPPLHTKKQPAELRRARYGTFYFDDYCAAYTRKCVEL